jgi:histidyl-tRNA synthetase
MPPTIQRPKGTQDSLPTTLNTTDTNGLTLTAAWQHVEASFRQFMAQAGYHEVRTPVFEATELFARGVGETTDIVNKEMYGFTKGDRDLTLRPEGTAGVVRAYLENGMARWPKPVKLFYLGPMFRYERPQAGRQRQFHQAGLELLGLDTPAADAEVLLLAMRWFAHIGLPNLTLTLNNLGTATCREGFKTQLKAALAPAIKTDFCETCQTRYDTNPLRILDCKVPTCQTALSPIADLLETEYASDDSQAHFNAVCHTLTAMGVPWQRNRRLVRGLDYYTGLVFEVVADEGLGSQNTVCGGGRYNGLAQLLGGPDTPAIGWAFGLERLLTLLPLPATKPLDYYICADAPTMVKAFTVADQLRAQGYAVEVDLSGKPLAKKRADQLAMATKRGAIHAIYWPELADGETEVAQDTFMVKHLALGTVETRPLSML